eukprot:GHVU01193445.1.p1 GENE.GHVU01193445.1~~GHVU01193445.1.p1  ORF type:complete len:137 (+),score=3.42 GHVU01193445.1:284-694(+)
MILSHCEHAAESRGPLTPQNSVTERHTVKYSPKPHTRTHTNIYIKLLLPPTAPPSLICRRVHPRFVTRTHNPRQSSPSTNSLTHYLPVSRPPSPPHILPRTIHSAPTKSKKPKTKKTCICLAAVGRGDRGGQQLPH